MKKIFFLAATMIAAISANAVVYDLTQVTNQSDFTITGAVANSGSTETKWIYDMSAAGTPIVVVPTAVTSNVEFSIVHGTDVKTKYFTVESGKYFEFGGKGGLLTIKGANPNDVVVLHIANKSDKGDGAINVADCTGVTGADVKLPAKNSDGYTWVDATYTATASTIVIKENVYGYRITSISVGAGTGWNDAKVAPAASRIMKDGKVYIQKANGKLINMLGF